VQYLVALNKLLYVFRLHLVGMIFELSPVNVKV
jgi:hypothetical protein